MKHLFLALFASLMLGGITAQAKKDATAKKQSIPAAEAQVGQTKIRADYYGNGIVRVRKYPASQTLPEKKSYSVIMALENATKPSVKVSIDKTTGCVSFTTVDNKLLLKETGMPQMTLRTDDANRGKLRVAQSWQLDNDEQIFGLGQLRKPNMSQRGQKVEIWNNNTYISIPYITSEKGYGLYWDNAGKSYFEDSDKGMNFTSEVATCIDYYFMYKDGSQDGVVACIRQLTGQATMFPRWAMGHWQCRERYKTSDELATVLDRYRELNIPLDAIVQDWQYWGCDSNWNAMRFENPYYINKVGDEAWAKYLPDDLKKLAAEYKAKGLQPRLKSPQEMVDYVHKNNAHLMISIWASFGPWTQPYRELKEIGALMPFDTWPRQRGVMPYDAFNPKARDIYWKYLSHLYQMGFDAWWTDSTEPDHFEKPGDENYQTYDGSWLSVKNAFPLMTNKGIYEHQRQAEAKKMKKQKNYIGKRSLQMTRSGSFGLQHYGAFSWSGDVQSSWEEMKNQVPSGLNYALCGIPFWNTDLGGFFYWDYNNDPKSPAMQELHTRWMQWGAFMPLMRNHCSSPMVSELYEFGSEGDWAYDSMLRFIRLRYRMLPYIYSMAGDAVQHSGTLMRPLVMDFAKDRKAIVLNDEYMFGKSLLVKPVTDPLYTWKDASKRGHAIYPDVRKAAAPVSIYLPEGTTWYDFWTGRQIKGGRTIQRPCPIDEMPVYVRAGSIVPFGKFVQHSAEETGADLEIRVYPGADGTFVLYEDEGDGYNYERGMFTEIPFTWDNATSTLTIGDRRGSFKGMLQHRTFRIVVAPKGDAVPNSFNAVVDYSGKAVSVKL